MAGLSCRAFLVFAVGVLVIKLPLCLFVVRDSPDAMGLLPDGARRSTPPAIQSVGSRVPRRDKR